MSVVYLDDMGSITFKSGWIGESDHSIFFEKNSHPSTGTNIFLQKLVENLKENFCDKEIEIHFNVQPTISRKRKFLILLEHNSIRPQNYFHYLYNYEQIFGWDLRLNKLTNFTYVRYPHDYSVAKYNPKRNLKYCMIGSNRNIIMHYKNLSLYDRRQDVISYFDHPKAQFELYGAGWNTRFRRSGIIDFVMYRIGPLRKLIKYITKVTLLTNQ